jgi:hypothetical protein
MTQALPFRFVGQTMRRGFEQAVSAPLSAWSEAWFIEPPTAQLKLEDAPWPANSQTQGQWQWAGSAPDAWVAWRQTDAPWSALGRLLFGAGIGARPTPSPVTEAVLAECMADLAFRVLQAAGLPPSENAPPHAGLTSLRHGYGSGAVFGFTGASLPAQALLFGGEVVARLAPQRTNPARDLPPLTPRAAAIDRATSSVEVVLGEAELSLAQLAGIGRGDVLRLDTRFREPVVVRGDSGAPFARANLGRRDERLAIQFTKKK